MREIINRLDLNKLTDKDTSHSYIEPYEELFRDIRDKRCNLLEIGVCWGGSALIWHEYLPYSQLFLLDIRNSIDARIKPALNPSRYDFCEMNAYTPQAVNIMKQKCPDGFDIIIDDGNHHPACQAFVLKEYSTLLKEKGILVIEDVTIDLHLPFLMQETNVLSNLNVKIFDLRYMRPEVRDNILFVASKK